jgi:hypothetical protein
MDYKHIYEDIMNSDPKIRLVSICDSNGKVIIEKAYKIYSLQKKVKNPFNWL